MKRKSIILECTDLKNEDIHGSYLIVTGERNIIHCENSTIYGDYNLIFGSNLLVTGNHNTIIGTKNKVQGNHNLISGNENILMNGKENTISGQNNYLQKGDKTKIYGTCRQGVWAQNTCIIQSKPRPIPEFQFVLHIKDIKPSKENIHYGKTLYKEARTHYIDNQFKILLTEDDIPQLVYQEFTLPHHFDHKTITMKNLTQLCTRFRSFIDQITQEDKERLTCRICDNAHDHLCAIKDCGHCHMCYDCLTQLTKANKTCPFCFTPIKQGFVLLYDI